jgi:hypothetical protein
MKGSKKADTKKAEKKNTAEYSKDVSYTKKFNEGSKVIDSKLKAGGMKELGVVSKKSTVTAKPYEKKFLPGDKKRTYASIVDGKGAISKSADKRLGPKTANKKLYDEYKKDSTDTMNRRNKNLNYVNVHTGKKTNLNSKDLKNLLATNKITKK